MRVWDEYVDIFSKENLQKIYEKDIVLSIATGIDNMSHKLFWEVLDKQISIISDKAKNGKYETIDNSV